MNNLNSREANFSQFVITELDPFWDQTAQPGLFNNYIGLDIHYVYLPCQNPKGGVVISPGRVEGYLKYKELAYDLVHQGYQVFIIDHQGQGLSSRILRNSHKGYVQNFDDYIVDLNEFVESVVQGHNLKSLHLICHSMGGAIGLRYIQKYPMVFKTASFSSPMWGFISANFPENMARNIVKLGNRMTEWTRRDSAYFFGGKNYTRKAFENNELTTSEVRYNYFRDIYDQHPNIQLGGITFGWLQASIDALDLAFAQLDRVKIPILVLQAGDDTVVDNKAQDEFCEQLQRLNPALYSNLPMVIAGSQHEIFIEADQRRVLALKHIFQFMDKHNTN